jgi:uncharacterized caspase-like protein
MSTFARVVLIACVASALALPRVASAEQRYALVIGANPGWSSDRPLRYAETDAERIRDVLVALGGFAPDRVELLRDPSSADVRSAFRKLDRTLRSSSEDTLVFVYYSGHADDQNVHLRGEALSHQELQASLRGLPATIKLAVIDACKSGAVTRKGGAPAAEFDVSVVDQKLSGMVILTSSGADELSQESRALAGSVFTHHLVSGLRGAADDNGDHQVTVSEAYHYAYNRTRADTAVGGPPQRPAFRYELSGQGELVLTRLAAGKTAQMTLPRGGHDRYVVLDQHEWRLIAEARREPDREVVLALAPGNYRVKRVLSDRLEVGNLSLAAGDHMDVDRLHYDPVPLSLGILKGDANDLPPPERHDWQRAQAFGLLADGQAQVALGIFDQLLRESPADTLAWRGRGRALVRLAEAYQKINDHVNERRSLADAVRADPSLSEDPLFQIWYQRLGELEAREKTEQQQKMDFQEEIRKNPRTVKRYGLGFDLISTRGTIAVTGTLVLHRMFFPTIAVDLAGPGLDASISVAPFSSRWSPYLGLGAHVSAKKLGLVTTGETGTVMVDQNSYSYDEMWGMHARAEAGAQFVGTGGFTTELGLALLTFKANNGQIVQQMWPVLHFGWLW